MSSGVTTYSLRPPHAVISENSPLAGRIFQREVQVETDIVEPSLTFWPAASHVLSSRAGVVICPGGGYEVLAAEHEGAEVARWLNSLGLAAFVLRYRVPRPGYPAPLEDACAAVRLVRSRCDEFGVDRARVGLLGFSAGAHLAGAISLLPVAEPESRPDFLVLTYPLATMIEAWGHAGSCQTLLGSNPSPELRASLSLERCVDRHAPPTFLMHAADDDLVPVENSVSLFRALRCAGVPAELHVYERGGHGFGLGVATAPVSDWPHRCEAWLRQHGWLLEGGSRPRSAHEPNR